MVSYIPNELSGLRFFSINKNKEIKINDIINPNDKLYLIFMLLILELIKIILLK